MKAIIQPLPPVRLGVATTDSCVVDRYRVCSSLRLLCCCVFFIFLVAALWLVMDAKVKQSSHPDLDGAPGKIRPRILFCCFSSSSSSSSLGAFQRQRFDAVPNIFRLRRG